MLMKSKADQDWKERLKMEEDKKHNQTRRLEAFRELVEMLDSIETCRHTAFDVPSSPSVQERIANTSVIAAMTQKVLRSEQKIVNTEATFRCSTNLAKTMTNS